MISGDINARCAHTNDIPNSNPFNPSQESFTIYIERIKLFFVTDEVAANTYTGASLPQYNR